MAFRMNDRDLAIGLGLFLCAAAFGIRYAINDIVRLTEVDSIDKIEAASQPEHCEDAITLETLRTLATSPNVKVANAAKAIILERFNGDPLATTIMTKDAHSEDESVRRRAQTAMEFRRRFMAGRQLVIQDHHPPHEWELESLPDELRFPPPMTGVVPSEADPVAGWVNVPRERPDDDDAERDPRRRRREAMVMHDGGGHM